MTRAAHRIGAMPASSPAARARRRADAGASPEARAARSTNANDYQHVPRPVAAMPKAFPDRASTGWHSHRRAQLLFSLTGAMAVDTTDRRWLIPPRRALWVPPGLPHSVTMRGRVDMRTLYVEPGSGVDLPSSCVALEITPLAQELIIRATEAPLLYEEHSIDGLVMRLLLAEVARLPTLPLWLPLPRRAALAQLCEALLTAPDIGAAAAPLAQSLGISERSFARWFISETGLTFGQWKQRACVLAALDRLSAGAAVARVALDLGYDSPSAFTAMFRKTLGISPRELGRAKPRTPIVAHG
ncbi:MAG: helix-turn-helix transcriptional regulator [Burkholderiales bacterium]|nr:helix-turn-helix transcriptional regulator [Burkholderiales bacterium]